MSTNDPANPLFEIPCTIIVSKEGIATISLDDRILVYPNPTRGELRISPLPLRDFPQRGKEEDSVNGELRVESVEIFDVMGRKQKAESSTSTTLSDQKQKAESAKDHTNISTLAHCQIITLPNSYDLTVFPSGIYFIRITTENGMITKKIIKN
jgi:hypothetical protein